VTNRRDFIRASLGAWAYVTSSSDTPHAYQPLPTAYLWDPVYLEHDTGAGHPERPQRIQAIDEHLRGADWYASLLQLEPRAAALATIERVHDPVYVAKVREEVEVGAAALSTGDTTVSDRSYWVALNAVGGALEAVDAVMEGRARNAFVATRPPGHHATRDRGMGFCIFNSVAVAARYAQEVHGIERVLVADWDVHHGNGTQDIFYRDPTVFYMSTHQWPLYPGTGRIEETGEGLGVGFTMNRPFGAGAGDPEIVGAFREDLLPAAREFRPDLVLVSAGFDSRMDDLLGGFRVTDDGFRELTRIMVEIAGIAGNGRVVSVLEGGYALAGLASGTRAHVGALVNA
jgi:acetoin utilization deacetylase AcuC-like enzyme